MKSQEQEPKPNLIHKSDWIVPMLSTATQSLMVGIWFYTTLSDTAPDLPNWLRIAFSIIAGIALDLTVIKTTTGDLERKSSWWSDVAVWAPFTAFLFSSSIAYDLFSQGKWFPINHQAFLHTGFAVVVWISGLYIAELRRQRLRKIEYETTELKRLGDRIAGLESQALAKQGEIRALQNENAQLARAADTMQESLDTASTTTREAELTAEKAQTTLELIKGEYEEKLRVALRETKSAYEAEIHRERDRWLLDLERVNYEVERLQNGRESKIIADMISGIRGNVTFTKPIPAATIDSDENVTEHLRTLLRDNPNLTNEEIEAKTKWPREKFNRQAARVRREMQSSKNGFAA